MNITLPAIHIEPVVTETNAGRLVVPGHTIAAKQIDIDLDQVTALLLAARKAALNAHAPYSKFRVGAAAIMADDPASTIHIGSNVENSSYGATVCAERTGLLHCAALGFRRLRYLAVSTVDSLNQPLFARSPCGVCRQVAKEFTNQNVHLDTALILIDNGDPETLCEIFDIERLLPYGFNFSGPEDIETVE